MENQVKNPRLGNKIGKWQKCRSSVECRYRGEKTSITIKPRFQQGLEYSIGVIFFACQDYYQYISMVPPQVRIDQNYQDQLRCDHSNLAAAQSLTQSKSQRGSRTLSSGHPQPLPPRFTPPLFSLRSFLVHPGNLLDPIAQSIVVITPRPRPDAMADT